MEDRDVTFATPPSKRISHLDTIRGVAVMGILIMNAVSYFFGSTAYFDISQPKNTNSFDWIVALFGEIFADQKFMALFSLLFGASILLFCERAEAKGHSAVKLSLWRNFLLLIIGLTHSMFWEGDILTVYAICAPILLMCRKTSPTILISLGAVIYLTPVFTNGYLISIVDPSAFQEVWASSYIANPSLDVEFVFLGITYEAFARALGMMFIGMGFYSNGKLIHANSSDEALKGNLKLILVGIFMCGTGVLWTYHEGFSTVAIIQGNLVNTIGTIPMALGYLGLLMWWNENTSRTIIKRIQALGKTALSNYIGQTVVCLILAALLPQELLTRSVVFLLILGIWWMQLFLSEQWLKRYRFGPLEYLWRCATYRRIVAFVNRKEKVENQVK